MAKTADIENTSSNVLVRFYTKILRTILWVHETVFQRRV